MLADSARPEAVISPPDPLFERLDELSARLILHGSQSLTALDLHRLADDAEAGGSLHLAEAAAHLAEWIGDSPSTDPDLLSAGLSHLRAVLDDSLLHSGSAAADALPLPGTFLAGDEEMVREFITESREHLSSIEASLLLLEKNNKDTETLNAVFRAFHTIKGLSGFLEFPSIQSLAHEVESLLDLARSLGIEATSQVIDLVLESTDVLRQELINIELVLAGKHAGPSAIHDVLIQRIRAVTRSRVAGSEELSPVPVRSVASKPLSRPSDPAPQPAAPRSITESAPLRPQSSRLAEAASVRIDTAKLDQLMDMVGELVIAHTLVSHNSALASLKDPRLVRDLNHVARITADVQRVTTGMRMVPIGQQFQRLSRLVRDLSRRAEKDVVLETSGEDTELDKTIAEELADPLLHMVRNSVDHGIEALDERLAAGKSAVAHIRISAYHRSGQIVVELSDDGRGLDREKILAKALRSRLISADAQLTDQEIFLLIFEPGFSTATSLTDISGRGVGMDVVRRHVQRLRGRIEIDSQPGLGTTFRIRLPLTLAIIDGLKLSVGTECYVLPLFCVKEMFRPSEDMLSTVQNTGEMVLLRGGLLPIVRLHQRFVVEPRTTRLTEGILIVVESEGRQFCLFVDELAGKQEVVIKSLGNASKGVAGISGCAILGDGRVGLILDVEQIYKGRA